MVYPRQLSLALFLLRISVALVFVMWAILKLILPERAAGVFANFYYMDGLGNVFYYAIGALQLAIVLAFAAGAFKRLTYPIILILHLVSTASTYQQLLTPYDKPNLLFYAAIPMLAAAFAVWILREHDMLLSVDARRGR